MEITRRYTVEGHDPFAGLTFVPRTSRIANPDGSVVFEMKDLLAAPNSPQWFNTGLHWAYGIDGPPQGHSYVDPQTGEVTRSTSAYERCQPHACLPYNALVTTPAGPIPIGEIVTRNLIGLP